MKYELFLILISLLLLLGCVDPLTLTYMAYKDAESRNLFSDQAREMIEENAKHTCIKLCNDSFAMGVDLSNGPCLGNPMEHMPEYVCDIAHNPRTEIDNLSENQCSAFGEGTAKHFVELNETCELIKIG